MARHRLTDEQWELIEDIFPEPADTGRPPADPREMIDGCLWRLRTGAPWRDLPEEYGSWSTVFNYFDEWNSDGTLDEVKRRLLQQIVDENGVDTGLWCVDGTVVRAARCAGGGGKKKEPDEPEDHGLGRSRGGFSTKIHLICDADGCPINFEVSAGQEHENTNLIDLLNGIDAEMTTGDGKPVAWPVAIAGDKGYRAEWIDEMFLEMGITPVIPSKANEDCDARPVEFDKDRYRERNIVERLIGWLKECRSVFARYEKTAINFCGMIKLACIQRYLRILAP